MSLQKAKAFLKELEERKIMWREWNALPQKFVLGHSPATWE